MPYLPPYRILEEFIRKSSDDSVDVSTPDDPESKLFDKASGSLPKDAPSRLNFRMTGLLLLPHIRYR